MQFIWEFLEGSVIFDPTARLNNPRNLSTLGHLARQFSDPLAYLTRVYLFLVQFWALLRLHPHAFFQKLSRFMSPTSLRFSGRQTRPKF